MTSASYHFVLCPGWAMPDDLLQGLGVALGVALGMQNSPTRVLPIILHQLRGGGLAQLYETSRQTADQPAGQWIGIGHSSGFAALLRQRWPWAGLVSVAGFTRFADPALSAGVARRQVQTLCAAVQHDPQSTLRRFYRQCGLPLAMLSNPSQSSPKPFQSANTPHLQAQLHVLARQNVWHKLLRLRRLGCPVLALAAQHDAVVPAALTQKSFLKLEQRWHPTAGHSLGYTEIDWCCQQIVTWLQHTLQPETVMGLHGGLKNGAK